MKRQVILMRFTAEAGGAYEVHLEMNPMDNPTAVAGCLPLTIPGAGGGAASSSNTVGAGGNITGAGPWPTIYICWW